MYRNPQTTLSNNSQNIQISRTNLKCFIVHKRKRRLDLWFSSHCSSYIAASGNITKKHCRTALHKCVDDFPSPPWIRICLQRLNSLLPTDQCSEASLQLKISLSENNLHYIWGKNWKLHCALKCAAGFANEMCWEFLYIFPLCSSIEYLQVSPCQLITFLNPQLSVVALVLGFLFWSSIFPYPGNREI